MDELGHYSIADLYRSLQIPVDQEVDFSIHFLPSMHEEFPFQSSVFRTDYFSFVFVKSGKGSYTTDERSFPFEERTIYFTNPGHIKAFYIEEVSDAYIIMLTESFLRENVHPDIFSEFSFLLAETVPPKILDQKAFEEFEAVYQQILAEFGKESKFKMRILGSLFVVLLLKIKEMFWESYDPIEDGDRNSQIVKSFKKLLEEQFNRLRANEIEYAYQVQDYARDLRLHPNYLSQVIKAKTGKTVHHWIQDKTLGLAKALLKHTNLSSKEIAYRLGFKEPTHFSRFFKNQTGNTPTAFKKAFNL